MISASRFSWAIAIVFSVPLIAFAQEISNWPAPAYWTPPGRAMDSSGERSGLRIEASTSPLPFIGVTPCRLLDTRPPANNPLDGDGIYGADEIRTYALPGACGLPSTMQAVSLNVTVTNTGSGAFGHIKIWPADQAEPNVSTLNYPGVGATLANATVVPLSVTGALNVKSGNASADVILDVNGYYAPAGVGIGNTFLGLNSGNFTMAGIANTGIGVSALSSNTTGQVNTAIGASALSHNTTGNANTATGGAALSFNTEGSFNTATGTDTLRYNTTGEYNTASGYGALLSNTAGGGNTAIGASALNSNETGFANTATGYAALANNTGGFNTAVGQAALGGNTTGSYNIAIGNWAGTFRTTGNYNIDIGSYGAAEESATIRIGTGGTHERAFLAGVRGVTTGTADGLTVLIDSNGQLGTTSSSASVKREISDIGEASSALLELRPVSFFYRNDTAGVRQYGLVAEEVARVMPDLVLFSSAGNAEAVRYHFLATLLLNELQKEHRRNEEQESTIEKLLVRLDALEARVVAEGEAATK